MWRYTPFWRLPANKKETILQGSFQSGATPVSRHGLMDFGHGRSPPLTLRSDQLSIGASVASRSTATISLHHHQQHYDGHHGNVQPLDVTDTDGTTNVLLRTMESVYSSSMTAEDDKNKSLRDKIHVEELNRRLRNDLSKVTAQLQEEKNRRMSESTVQPSLTPLHAPASASSTRGDSPLISACLPIWQLTADLASNTILMQQIVTDQNEFKVRLIAADHLPVIARPLTARARSRSHRPQKLYDTTGATVKDVHRGCAQSSRAARFHPGVSS